MPKKLYGAAAAAHAKKAGKAAPKTTKKTAKKTTKKAVKSTAGLKAVHHKAYSYTNKKGKTVHVGAHTEHIKVKK